jgi:hypothetical protein
VSSPGRALGERRRQVFLQRDELAVGVLAEVDDAESAGRQFLDNLIAAHHRARGQRGWFGL